MAARRLTLLALLTGVVAGLHACVGDVVGERLDALHSAPALPPRINVAYVKTLQQQAPPEVAPAPAPAPTPPRPPRRPRPPQPAPPPAPDPAPPLEEPAPPPEPAASAPAPEPAASAVAEAEAASAAEPALPPASAPKPGFAWPSSTRLSYTLGGKYRDELHGKAQVEWIRRGDHYQVHMDVGSGLLFERHMRSEGRVTPEGLVPSRYDQETKRMLQATRSLSMQFDADSAMLATGQRVPSLPGMQDTASQFVQLTYLFRSRPERLRPGERIEVPLALPRHVSVWSYDVLQPEVLSTPIGPIETFQLRPQRQSGRPNDLKAEIWFAPTLQYLPVRIRIELDESTYIDLLIAKAPEIGEAE